MPTVVVTDDSFATEVEQSDKPVLVDFWATWCGPCRVMEPILEQLSDEMQDTLKIVKLDVDDNPQRQEQFGVMSIPTMILFKGGQPVEQLVGSMPKDAVMAKLAPHLS